MRGARPAHLVLLGLTISAGSIGAHAAVPDGSEFQVNVYTSGAQRIASVAVDGDGDFVVVWNSQGQDGSVSGVFARRFDSAGAPQGAEFQVNSHTESFQASPRVAMASGGQFVVVWASYLQDGDYDGVFGQRFDSSGAAQGGEFQVNTYTAGGQPYAAVAMDNSGAFTVAWTSYGQDGSEYGIFAARFDANGVRMGVEFQVNKRTSGSQTLPDIGSDGDGGFVVVWEGAGDGGGNGIFARRFDPFGVPVGAELQVNTYTQGRQAESRIGMNSDGDFVVAWDSPHDGAIEGTFARRFSHAGIAQGAEFQVNTYTFGTQNLPVPAMDAGGGFVIVWIDATKDGSFHGIFARRFGSTGAAETPEFQVNTYTGLYQFAPSLAIEGDGDFVVVWQSNPQDGDLHGVFGQRFRHLADFDVDGDGVSEPLTDGLLILRFLFGFRGATLVTGAVGPACTRCDGPSIEAYCAARL